jgi:hypothetical protein
MSKREMAGNLVEFAEEKFQKELRVAVVGLAAIKAGRMIYNVVSK